VRNPRTDSTPAFVPRQIGRAGSKDTTGAQSHNPGSGAKKFLHKIRPGEQHEQAPKQECEQACGNKESEIPISKVGARRHQAQPPGKNAIHIEKKN